MKIYVDTTEPGTIFHALGQRCQREGIALERTLLHKRPDEAGSMRASHPFYGLGADYVVADGDDLPYVGIERKTTGDLAKCVSIPDDVRGGNKLFRQLRDLAAHPTPILLIEGNPTVLYRSVESAITGLQFWCAREGIAIMYTSSPLATANAVFLMARKLRGEVETGPALGSTWTPEAPPAPAVPAGTPDETSPGKQEAPP